MCFFVGGGPTQPGRGEYSISVERDKGKRRNMLTACLLKAKYCSRLNLTDDRGSKINRRSRNFSSPACVTTYLLLAY